MAFSPFVCFSQKQCEDKVGFDKRNGNLTLATSLRCHLSALDTTTKAFISASLAKTKQTNGIIITGIFNRDIGTIDGSSKLKFVFVDKTFIHTSYYMQQANNIGMFFAVVEDKYSLLLLKSKPIEKIEITGDLLNAATYQTDVSTIDFMLGMECLQSYL